jgi:hypothetical protein
VARAIEKPLLINGDVMEERNASFWRLYVCIVAGRLSDAHVEWIIASDQHVKSIQKNIYTTGRAS